MGSSTKVGPARLAATAAVAMIAALSIAGPAWAAGSSYTGGGTSTGSSTGGTGAPPGYTTVLTTQTVQPSGGTVTTTGGGSTITVVVPAGATASAIQIEITEGTLSALTGLPSGSTPVLAYGITILLNGQKDTATFSPPLKVTISNPKITSANSVVIWDPGTGTFAPAAQSTTVSGVTVASGSVTFDITADPYTALLAGSSTPSAPVAGATTPSTGFPWITELVAGLALIAGGLLLALRLRRSPS